MGLYTSLYTAFAVLRQGPEPMGPCHLRIKSRLRWATDQQIPPTAADVWGRGMKTTANRSHQPPRRP